MAAILLVVLYFGGIAYAIGIGLVATIAFKELLDVKKECKIPSVMKIVGLICMLMLTYVNIDGRSLILGLSYETLSLVFLLLLAPTVFLTKRNYKVGDAFYLSAVTLFLGTIFNLFIVLFEESKLLFIFVIFTLTF
jgi:CDP-diglyceride synthetase